MIPFSIGVKTMPSTYKNIPKSVPMKNLTTMDTKFKSMPVEKAPRLDNHKSNTVRDFNNTNIKRDSATCTIRGTGD